MSNMHNKTRIKNLFSFCVPPFLKKTAFFHSQLECFNARMVDILITRSAILTPASPVNVNQLWFKSLGFSVCAAVFAMFHVLSDSVTVFALVQGSKSKMKLRRNHALMHCRFGIFWFLFFNQPSSVRGWTSAFLLAVHRLGRLGHFLPRWLRTSWQSAISQGKIPWNTPPWLGIEPGPWGKADSELSHWAIMTD